MKKELEKQQIQKIKPNPIDKLPLFILLIDTNKPDEGSLCKMNEVETILGIVIRWLWIDLNKYSYYII